MEPSCNNRFLTKSVNGLGESKECCLKRFFAIFSAPDNSPSCRQDHRTVSSYKLGECTLVPPLLKPDEQLRIGSLAGVKPLHHQANGGILRARLASIYKVLWTAKHPDNFSNFYPT